MNAIPSLETRNVERDSLFLFAFLRVEGHPADVRVKVRNLSAGGMMAEGGGVALTRGDRLEIGLRNIGEVTGSVAWVQGTRFGIAFDSQIDPILVRAPVQTSEDEAPRFTRAARHSSFDGDVRAV